jgi:hypothetical protein
MSKEYYDGKTVKVANLNNQFEADVIREILQDQGIVAVLRPYEDMAYGDLFVSEKGFCGLWVPPEHLDTAKKLLAEIRKDDHYLVDDGELTAEALSHEAPDELEEDE